MAYKLGLEQCIPFLMTAGEIKENLLAEGMDAAVTDKYLKQCYKIIYTASGEMMRDELMQIFM